MFLGVEVESLVWNLGQGLERLVGKWALSWEVRGWASHIRNFGNSRDT
jgi:hypothetical protein